MPTVRTTSNYIDNYCKLLKNKDFLSIMLNFNENLKKSLQVLYEYSKNFKLSLELIQSLSQQLKLDTFVDVDAYSHIIDQPLRDENNQVIKFQRLSIAGSLILIDIDLFELKILRVSFSLANQLDNNEAMDLSSDEDIIKISPNDDLTTISIDFGKSNPYSLLNKSHSDNIESILLNNLRAPILNNFPHNLKHLANLDRLSSSSIDLFAYSDNLALILKTLNNIELKDSQDWKQKMGLTTSLGNVKIFDSQENKIGLFIDFWQDFRFINHEYQIQESTSDLLLGRNYKLLLNLSSKLYSTPIDYILETKDHTWELNGQKFQFQFDDESHLFFNKGSNSSNGTASSNLSSNPEAKFDTNWTLVISLDNPIYLPLNLLEFIGMGSYEEAKLENGNFDKLNTQKEIKIGLSKDEDTNILIRNELHSVFVPIQMISLKRLVDITTFISIFRNHIVLTNILNELTKNCSTHVYTNEEKMTEEVKHKLKDTLALSKDATDEQILSLNILNEKNIEDEKDIALDEFMKEEPNREEADDNDDLKIKIIDIDYDSQSYNISISITGKYKGVDVDILFIISNGEILPLDENPSSKDDMEVDDDENKVKKFIKSLNLTEDIIKSFNFVYLNKL